jgi:hypothetical protein
MRSFIIFILTKYYEDDEIKENYMDRECTTHGRDKKCTQNAHNIRSRNLNRRYHLGVSSRRRLEDIIKEIVVRVWNEFK